MNCGTFVVIHIPPHARRLDWWLAWHTQSGLLNSLAKCRSCSIILCLWSRALNTQQESLSSRFEWISILLLFCRRQRKGPSEEGARQCKYSGRRGGGCGMGGNPCRLAASQLLLLLLAMCFVGWVRLGERGSMCVSRVALLEFQFHI